MHLSLPKLRRSEIISLGVLLFLFCSLGVALYLSQRSQDIRQRAFENKNTNTDTKKNKPVYVQGEVIIKLKPKIVQGKSINLQLKSESISRGINLNKQSISVSDLEPSSIPSVLNLLDKKYKIKTIDKVFKGSGTSQQDLSLLKQSFTTGSSLNSRVMSDKEFLKTDLSQVYKLSMDKTIPIEAVMKDLTANSEIEFAEPVVQYKSQFVPNDPYYLDHYPDNTGLRDPTWNPMHDYQWNLKTIHMDQAWEIATGLGSISVAVIDTGVDYTHPDLGGCTLTAVNNNQCSKVLPGWDFVNNDNDPIDDNGHGTHVSGIIAAITNNTVGISGIDKGGMIKILPIKGLDHYGSGDSDQLAAGIDYAVLHGARVVNLSWGGYGNSYVIYEAIQRGVAAGTMFVVAAGNNDSEISQFFPANVEGVTTVAATTETDYRASYSNYGSMVTLSAPGGGLSSNILSLAPTSLDRIDQLYKDDHLVVNNTYLRMSGTSMATPHVVGLAALIMHQNSKLTSHEVENIMINSVDDLGAVGFDSYYGYGRINAQKALVTMDIHEPPKAKIYSPINNLMIGKKFKVYGIADATHFTRYQVSYSNNPGCEMSDVGYSSSGVTIPNQNQKVVENNLLAEVTLPDTTSSGVLGGGGGGGDPSGNRYCLKVTVETPEGNYFGINRFILDPMVPEGWPIKHGTHYTQSAQVVGDVNNDNKKEIVFMDKNDAMLYAYGKNGQNLSGFPTYTNQMYGVGPRTPAIDGQGIFLPVSPQGTGNWILGWNGLNGQFLSNWGPIDWNSFLLGFSSGNMTTIIKDINGDKNNDFIYAEGGGKPVDLLRMYTYDRNRRPLNGWENGVSYPPPYAQNSMGIISTTPRVGNVFGSVSSSEIVEVMPIDTLDGGYSGRIVVYDNLGVLKSNFTTREMEAISNLVLGDINGDGFDEIITTTNVIDPTNPWKVSEAAITVFKGDGQKLIQHNLRLNTNSTMQDYIQSLSLGDFNNDNIPEIFACTTQGVCDAIDKNGNSLLGFPTSAFGIFPTFSDYSTIVKLKNNNILIVQNRSWFSESGITAIEYNPVSGLFNVLSGFPKYFNPDLNGWIATNHVGLPISTDLDNDGKLDIVVPMQNNFYEEFTYVFDTGIEYKNIEWSQYLNNEGHTGAYTIPDQNVTPTPAFLSRVDIEPSQLKISLGDKPSGLSALAYDNMNRPIWSGVTYEWGISSIQGIGSINPINGNLTNFTPHRFGDGQIFVIAKINGNEITKSIPVTVLGNVPPMLLGWNKISLPGFYELMLPKNCLLYSSKPGDFWFSSQNFMRESSDVSVNDKNIFVQCR